MGLLVYKKYKQTERPIVWNDNCLKKKFVHIRIAQISDYVNVLAFLNANRSILRAGIFESRRCVFLTSRHYDVNCMSTTFGMQDVGLRGTVEMKIT